jgi:carboxyl-terminal processing protease
VTATKRKIACHLAAAALLIVPLLSIDAPAAFAESGRHRAASAPQRAKSLESRLELMLRTMRIARDWHIEAPNKSLLIAGAIEGLLARVDPEAELYTPADLRRVARFVPGGGAGVGLEVRREPAERRSDRKGYRIVAARDGSPAARAGLKAGDLITHVDGRPVAEIPFLVMTHVMLEGPAGSMVRLTVERSETESEPETVALERSLVFGTELSIDEVTPEIARVRIASLSEGTASTLARSWAAYSGDGAHQRLIRGVVLDLRSTAATSVEGARAVADAFLQSGPIVRMVSRHHEGSKPESATPGDLVDGQPIVVLVDGGTSGAAEMLVSALQEARRARVVGTKTAGRGAVRTLVSLDRRGRKGLLRMTTERFLTPGGAPIDGKGVAPEIPIEQLPASSRCRTLDIEDEAAPGVCVTRTLAQDTQLQRAISTLDEPLVASQHAPASVAEKP